MIRSYKYRLYPTKKHIELLDGIFRLHRELYNSALEERREAYRKCHKSINLYDQTYQIKEIRQIREDFGNLNFNSCQITLMRLDKAFKAFFRRVKAGQAPGFPRFKSRSRFNSVAFTFRNGLRIKDNRLYVQGVGSIKVKWHRVLPEDCNAKQVIVMRDSRDHWYAVFQIEMPDKPKLVHTGEPIGIDLGLSSFVTLSNGEKVEPPQYYRKAERKLRVQQRKVSRCKRFSRRWRKANKLVSKTHERISNQRKDFTHKLSSGLVNQYSLIAVEDLNVNGMNRSHFAKSINDAGWSQFLMMLTYKVENTGSQVVKVNPYNTSQVCSGCGSIVKKELSVRVHQCPDCGLVLDRDHNAAINILHKALTTLGLSVQPLTCPTRECVG